MDAKKEAEVDAKVDVKKDAKVDENKGIKVEANMGIKGGTRIVDVQTRCKTKLKTCHKTGCKTDANQAIICAKFRKKMQKMPKIAPTREIEPFFPKNEEKYNERWSRRKKGRKKRW